jgi:SAM-dependent methyltransferase
LLQRVLRRCARSVRGIGVPRGLALCFALQLLRAAGADRATRRRLLRTAPPWATAVRYEAAGKSEVYADRNPRRAAREAELLAAVWPGRASESVLDLPCGAGRLLPLLRDRFGHRVVQADGALAMLRTADERGRGSDRVQADALAMPFADGAFDGVVVFRFLHHLPPEAQRLVVAEACRVAGRFVVVSFFHPCSAHHLQRVLRGWLGAPRTRFAVSLGRLADWFAEHGYELRSHRAEAPYRRDLWLAAFERRTPAGTAAKRP